MVFKKYVTAMLARGYLSAGINAAAGSIILDTGEGDLFPSEYPQLGRLTKYDPASTLENKPVLKREIVEVTNKSGDTFSITRSAGYCPASDAATTQTNTAFTFDEGDEFCLIDAAEFYQDMQDEIERLENDKADDSTVVHNTGDEAVAGVKTFSDSPVGPTPTTSNQYATKGYVDATASAALDNSFMAGESISAGNCLYLERGVTFAQAVGIQNIGDVTANTRVGFKIVGSGVAASTLKLSLKKTGTPAGNLNVRIETDSAGSPSGSTVTNGTGSVTAASLSTSLADTTVTLAGSVTLTAGTTYRVVLYQGTYGAETISGTNYYNAGFIPVISERVGKLYNGSAWAVPATVTDNNGARGSTESTISAKRGLVIYSKYDQVLQKVTKDTSNTATKCYLFSGNDLQTTLVAIATFSGNDATFNYPMYIGQYYTIAWDNDGSNYNTTYGGGASYPVNGTNVNITTGMGGNTTQYLGLASITTLNYLKGYASSGAIADDLLFKTDADLAHKVPVALEPLKIAIEAAAVGAYPQYTVPGGLNKNVSGLTAGVEYFLSGTPGALSSTPGTYRYKVGAAITATIILQNSKSLLSAIQSAGSSPYTYQNTTGVPVQLVISGGTVSVVAYSRDGSTYVTVATATNTQIVLQPYDYCKITYSSLPTLYVNHY